MHDNVLQTAVVTAVIFALSSSFMDKKKKAVRTVNDDERQNKEGMNILNMGKHLKA